MRKLETVRGRSLEVNEADERERKRARREGEKKITYTEVKKKGRSQKKHFPRKSELEGREGW